MVSHKTIPVTAPSIAARVFSWYNNGSISPHIVVENLDGVASAAISYMESDDGASWTTVSGTPATVNPGEANGQVVASSRAMLALMAGGNVAMLATLTRHVNGAPTSLGAA